MRPARVLGPAILSGSALLVFLAPPLRAEKPDVQARLIVPESAAGGSRVPVVVEMSVGAGWHVNSHTPAEKFLIPTDVKLTAAAGTLAPVRYPPHVERRFEFADTPMLVYEGTVRFETELALPAEAGEKVSLTGTISFQACNQRQCFPPSRIPLDASLVVTASSRSFVGDAESPRGDGVTSFEVAYRSACPMPATPTARVTGNYASGDTFEPGNAFALTGRRRIADARDG